MAAKPCKHTLKRSTCYGAVISLHTLSQWFDQIVLQEMAIQVPSMMFVAFSTIRDASSPGLHLTLLFICQCGHYNDLRIMASSKGIWQ